MLTGLAFRLWPARPGGGVGGFTAWTAGTAGVGLATEGAGGCVCTAAVGVCTAAVGVCTTVAGAPPTCGGGGVPGPAPLCISCISLPGCVLATGEPPAGPLPCAGATPGST